MSSSQSFTDVRIQDSTLDVNSLYPVIHYDTEVNNDEPHQEPSSDQRTAAQFPDQSYTTVQFGDGPRNYVITNPDGSQTISIQGISLPYRNADGVMSYSTRVQLNQMFGRVSQRDV